MNTTVQGSAADTVNTATVNIQKRLEALSSVTKSHGHRENSFQRDKTGILTSPLHSKVKLLLIVMRKKSNACKIFGALSWGGEGDDKFCFLTIVRMCSTAKEL